MEIRFSQQTEHSRLRVHQSANVLGVEAVIDTSSPRHVRFTLWRQSGRVATIEQHDRVIRALLTLDPDATVRTAKAIYNGKADFERQRGKP